MSIQLLSTVVPLPTGFTPAVLERWQLLAATIGLYTDNLDSVRNVVGDLARLRGVLITEAPTLASENLSRHLIWLRLPPSWRNEAATLVAPILEYLDSNMELDTRQQQSDNQIERLRYDLESMHQDYQRVTGRLQRQLHQLRDAETALKQMNEQLEQRVQLRTAELESAIHELESFSFSVSHDLRAPLRAIIGFTDDLQQRLDARLLDDERAQLARVLRLGKRMNQLIDDLLRLARTSELPLRPLPIDLSALAADVWRTLEQTEQNQAIAFHCCETPAALADPALLRVVLENLLSNARKFSQKTVKPHVEFGYDAAMQAYVVRDNGAGFDMADASQLFAPFRRLHRQEEFEGTGIGLATVARIIKRHNGRIWPLASVGHGAQFFFTLMPAAESLTALADSMQSNAIRP